ncbi:MAG: D-alanine--D-alanine ligase [Gammaproteobacteria bacterium HGW-Gammaproteobacteria-3]|nr:MAG: D-alanine--D-alanine ligase [Gammaproteobacteria bacterium HGW-Gammaproteobacteria-3]
MRPRLIHEAQAFGRVAVMMGGTSEEREISLKSGQAVYAALIQQGVDAVPVDVTGSPIDALKNLEVTRVFNMIHGRGGEDGVLQGVLEALALPFTGSGVLASALSMDKLRTKLCWRGLGLATPAWFQLHSEHDVDACIAALGFPVIVKPAQEGSSIGMSKACSRKELIDAWQLASQYRCEVYAEAWVNGKEYTVAVLGNEALPVIRLETPHAFYDYDAKYRADSTRYHCPCGLPQDTEKALQALALGACEALMIKGWGRVDVFIDTAGISQLIEVNTVPGMTDHSLVPMAAKQAGMSFEELVWRILESSFS